MSSHVNYHRGEPRPEPTMGVRAPLAARARRQWKRRTRRDARHLAQALLRMEVR